MSGLTVHGRHVAGRVPPGIGAVALSQVGRGGFALLLVLALWLQGCVVVAHYHEQPGGPAFAVAGGSEVQRAPLDHRHAPTAPDSCPLCQQIAIAGAYLPAPSVDFALPAQQAAWYAAVALRRALPRQRSHAWRSRGPPAAPHL